MSNAAAAFEKLNGLIGNDSATGDWFEITQDQINDFADCTHDHQFIHVDPERATPVFGGTIAHGFLTLSMVPHLGSSVPAMDPKAYAGMVMGVNYGLDKVRFPSPVKVDSRIRARRELVAAELKNPTTIQTKQRVTIEIEGEDKPACVAETLTRLIYS